MPDRTDTSLRVVRCSVSLRIALLYISISQVHTSKEIPKNRREDNEHSDRYTNDG